MQSTIPPLPISRLNDNKSNSANYSIRGKFVIQHAVDRQQQASKSNSGAGSAPSLLRIPDSEKKARLAADSSPYRNAVRFYPLDPAGHNKKLSKKNSVTQRIGSAKMLQIKQLQNKLADAHYHLNELTNENKLLKAIQKRQETALRRYEGTNAELPRIINSHQEELRVLQARHKKLSLQYRNTCAALKEKENELQSLQTQNKKLLQLSKDKHLGEREKLQTQVNDLNHKIAQQEEITQGLRRKLGLDTKYLTHQLNAEIAKNKDLSKRLTETEIKLKSLEELLEQQMKRSYNPNHLLSNGDGTSSRSLTNLTDQVNVTKKHRLKRHQSEGRKPTNSKLANNLPSINGFASYDDGSTRTSSTRSDFEFDKLTLPRTSPNVTLEKMFLYSSEKALLEIGNSKTDIDKKRDFYLDDNVNRSNYLELPKGLVTEKEINGFSSIESEFENRGNYRVTGISKPEFENDISKATELTNKSRLLHARLVGSNAEEVVTSGPLPAIPRKSLSQENFTSQLDEIKYDDESIVTVISRDQHKFADDLDRVTNCGSSCSDLDSEREYVNFENSVAKMKIENLPQQQQLQEQAKSKQLKIVKQPDDLTDKYQEFVKNTILETPKIKESLDQVKGSGLNLIGFKEPIINLDPKPVRNGKAVFAKNTNDGSGATHNNFLNRTSFDKDKLLAAMRAIDDNDNFDVAQLQRSRKNSVVQTQSSSRKKIDVIKELFSDDQKTGNKQIGNGQKIIQS